MFDWFTFIAQIINFLILLGILYFFLFRRIVKAIDEREQKIRSRWQDSEEAKKEAQKEKEKYDQKSRKFEEQRQGMLDKTQKEADKQKKKMIKEARDELQKKKNQWKQDMENEKQAFFEELQHRISNQVYAISRKMMKDLANAELQDQMVKLFLEKMRKLDEKQQNKIKQIMQNEDQEAKIISAFPITEANKNKIKKDLKNNLSMNKEIEFQEDTRLICGIEIQCNGFKISFSSDDYLKELENNFNDIFEQKTQENE